MEFTKKPIWAIKFKRFCEDHNISAKDVARALKVKTSTVYTYWQGKKKVPDEKKKILEKKLGLPIYETFFNEEL